MSLYDAVRAYDAGTLANLPDAVLLPLQANIDKSIHTARQWAADVRETVTAGTSADDYLAATQQSITKLEAISGFISRTTKTRYGCHD